jgi:hypothetical protein
MSEGKSCGWSPFMGAVLLLTYLNTTCNSVSLKNVRDAQKAAPQYHTEQVIGNETPERFYEVDGRKYYAEIDGQPIEQYISGLNSRPSTQPSQLEAEAQ